MGSVDKADQCLEPYDIDCSSLALFKEIGMHLIFRNALNAYIACKNESKSKAGFMEFLESLEKDFLWKHNPGSKNFSKSRKKILTPTAYQFVHWEKIGKRKRCRVYYPKRRDTA